MYLIILKLGGNRESVLSSFFIKVSAFLSVFSLSLSLYIISFYFIVPVHLLVFPFFHSLSFSYSLESRSLFLPLIYSAYLHEPELNFLNFQSLSYIHSTYNRILIPIESHLRKHLNLNSFLFVHEHHNPQTSDAI